MTVGFIRQALLLALVASGGMLGGALLFQYVGGLYPCEMCIWQRIPHAAILLLSGIGLLALQLGRAARARLIGGALALLFLVSAVLGLLHVGVEQHWWRIETRCTAPMDGADLNAILAAPITRCDDIPWSLFGISMAGYNALLSLAAAGALLVLLRRRP